MSSASAVGSTLSPQSVVANPKKNYTSAQIKKITLYALAILSAIAFTALLGCSCAGVITSPLVIIPLVFLPLAFGFSVVFAHGIKDYEDPIEFQRMRREAREMPYDALVREHGLENILKHNLVSPEILNEKQSYRQRILQIDWNYPTRQERLLRQLDRESLQAQRRANRLETDVRWAGYTTANAVANLQSPHSSPRSQANRQWATRGVGYAITELAAIPVQMYAENQLNQALASINQRRDQILQNGTGAAQQEAYRKEMQEAYDAHQSAMQRLWDNLQ